MQMHKKERGEVKVIVETFYAAKAWPNDNYVYTKIFELHNFIVEMLQSANVSYTETINFVTVTTTKCW